MNSTNSIVPLLAELELRLKQLKLWSTETPTLDKLQSTQPFALDTLSFEQWLQFIFLPRIRVIIQQQQEIPNMQLSPYAQEVLEPAKHQPLLDVIMKIDNAAL